MLQCGHVVSITCDKMKKDLEACSLSNKPIRQDHETLSPVFYFNNRKLNFEICILLTSTDLIGQRCALPNDITLTPLLHHHSGFIN